MQFTAWDDRMKARRTASMGVPYDYNQMTYDRLPMPVSISSLCESVAITIAQNGRGNIHPNNCLLNYYVDGNSSIGFHSDSAQNLVADTGVAVVSLGAVRTIVFREKKNRQNEFALPLQPGSLLYMTNDMQAEWLHGIPKEGCVGDNGDESGRISITLRQIEVGSDTSALT